MRRRPPKLIHLERSDRQEMQRLLSDGRTEQRIARRCRVLLAMEDPDTVVDDLAHEVRLTRSGVWYVCRRYEPAGLDAIQDAPRAGRPREISELERVAIQQLACCELHGLKLELTHWSTRTLTVMARQRLQRPPLAHSTVSLILRDADLKLHHSRYWITPTLDDEFVRRATRILWLYERIEWLLAHDEIVIALDEKPNLQALERARPTPPMRAGQGERQEFEYERHGTVNFVARLILQSGTMGACCLDQNDSEPLGRALPKLLAPFHAWRRVHLIWDGGPSHVSAPTQTFLRSYGPWLRVLFTPPHAEWLNQAELLLKSFTAYYLKRGSWRSRPEFIDHLYGSVPEYNRWYAHPINWKWTRRDLRDWVEWKTSGLC
jgi:DDE superfamily endonuclease/Homeodomain-like domain